MKKKLLSRIKKLKKEECLSYQDLAVRLGYKSGTTLHRFVTTGNIPKSKYENLNKRLHWQGY